MAFQTSAVNEFWPFDHARPLKCGIRRRPASFRLCSDSDIVHIHPDGLGPSGMKRRGVNRLGNRPRRRSPTSVLLKPTPWVNSL